VLRKDFEDLLPIVKNNFIHRLIRHAVSGV
jgi:hypothetical protein